MKCRYCGAAVEPGSLYCSRCGREIRIVPDYNPLDDVLEAQIRGGVDDAARTDSGQRCGMRQAGRKDSGFKGKLQAASPGR